MASNERIEYHLFLLWLRCEFVENARILNFNRKNQKRERKKGFERNLFKPFYSEITRTGSSKGSKPINKLDLNKNK